MSNIVYCGFICASDIVIDRR